MIESAKTLPGLIWHCRNAIALTDDQKERLQNLSVLILVNALIMGIGFFTRVKIANIVGIEVFGQMAYGLALGQLGAVVVRFGLDKTLVRDLIHFPDRFGKTVASSIALRGVIFLFVLFGFFFWKLCFPNTTDLMWGVIAIAVTRCLMALDLQSVYDTWQKTNRHAVYNFIQKCIYFSIIWAVALHSPSKLSLNLIGFTMMTAILLYLFMQYRWAFRREVFLDFRESIFGLALSMGKRNFLVCLSAFTGIAFGTMNQIILKFYCGTIELGGYAAAWQITLFTTILLLQVSRIAKPVTASVTRQGVDRKKRIEYLLKYSALIILLVTPICIPSVFFPKMILTILFRPEYASAAEILRVMGIYILIIGIGLVSSEYIIAKRMEKLYLASNFLGSGLSVVLCFVLIPKFSGLGAALSLLIGHGISMCFYLLGVIKDVGIKNPPAKRVVLGQPPVEDPVVGGRG